jgi:hypothetical protein
MSIESNRKELVSGPTDLDTAIGIINGAALGCAFWMLLALAF